MNDSSEQRSPDPQYRYRGLDCPVHGGNVQGRIPIEATKRGGVSVPPECVQCAEERGRLPLSQVSAVVNAPTLDTLLNDLADAVKRAKERPYGVVPLEFLTSWLKQVREVQSGSPSSPTNGKASP